MQFNYYFLKRLVPALKPLLVGKKIDRVFSQNKDELVITFEGNHQHIIKANLHNESSLLSFPDQFARAKKNSVDLFPDLKGLTVSDLRLFENERSFSIQLDNDFELLFKLHGRHSNVILFQHNRFHSLFKQNLDKDQNIDLNSLDRPIDQSDQRLIDTSFDLFALYPTFDKHIRGRLKHLGFYDIQEAEAGLKILHELLEQLNDKKTYLSEQNGSPQMTLFKPDGDAEVFTDPIEASNNFARRFFSNQGLEGLKSRLLSQVRKEIKKTESYLKQTGNKLKDLKNTRSYEELANILMANLHVKLDPGTKAIELLDFYTNETISVKLKPQLSLQRNAELLYRKAKNQAKELDILKQNIQSKETLLQQLQERYTHILEADNVKPLKALETSGSKGKVSSEPKPFIEMAVDGFAVYMGKNARNNDLLTQKFAKKDDLWLHARDVSGSHVIIRNPKGDKIPMPVIEKVAQVAAWHSKRRSDTLCPVIYTPKKYVRKPKGSLPGQVVLSQEQVILVKPAKTPS